MSGGNLKVPSTETFVDIQRCTEPALRKALLRARQAELAQKIREMEEEYRKIHKELHDYAVCADSKQNG